MSHKRYTPLLILLLVVFLSSCNRTSSQVSAGLQWRQDVYHQLRGNLSKPVTDRVQLMPAGIFKAIQADDRAIGIAGTGQYAPRSATTAELALIDGYIKRLPASYQAIFSKKLLAIYFVDNFAGAGMTNWLVDRTGETYYYIVFNTALLDISFDEWVSGKENSIFDHSSAWPEVRVKSGLQYKALLYGLLHEGAHVLDYEMGITPYVDQEFRKVKPRALEHSEFTAEVWSKRLNPDPRYDFPRRNDMNIYAEFANKGLISRAEMPVMFQKLKQTPFVTFYSGTSWAEDLADFMTYKYIETGLGGHIKVDLHGADKVINSYEPMHTALSRKREQSLLKYLE